MKTLTKVSIVLMVLSGSIFTTANSQNTNCNVTVQFTTVSEDVGFAPKHVMAIWVESGTSQFIKTMKVMADRRKQYLYSWNNKSAGNTVDAITGATKSSHSNETVTWNGKDVNQSTVPDGDYKIIIEFTEEHAQGPLLIIPFTKSTSNSDSTLNNETNFTSISIVYAASSTSAINEITAESGDFNVYPNPVTNESKIKIRVNKNTNARFSVYSLNGQRLTALEEVKLISGENLIDISKQFSGNELPAGTYLLRFEYNNEIKVVKLIKQ